jgi:tripartite-type tricarboxylate transporter receptor subunit TctC
MPTLSEAALPGYLLPNWVGLFAPAQTPMEIVMRLNAEISRWQGQPETQKMPAQGVKLEAGSPAYFGDRVARGHP